VIDVGELTVKGASTKPSVTELTPTKFVPVSVTVVPTRPRVGAKLVTAALPGSAASARSVSTSP